MDIKWGALEILGFSYRREKKVKIEVDTARVAPVIAKTSPPAAQPPTYSRDRAAERIAEKGKGKGPQGKSIRGKGGPEGGKTLTKV